MASPSTVITLGYGSFGSVNLVPTLGYGIGAAVIVSPIDTFYIRLNQDNLTVEHMDQSNLVIKVNESNVRAKRWHL